MFPLAARHSVNPAVPSDACICDGATVSGPALRKDPVAIIRPCVKEACCKYSDSVWCHFTAFTPSASFFPSTRPCALRLPVGAQLPLTVSLCQSASLGSWKERKKRGDGERERSWREEGRKEIRKKEWMDEGWMAFCTFFLTSLVFRIKS